MISTDDSKRTDVSQSWGVATLGDESLFSIGTGGTPSTSQPQFWNGNIPWVTPTDLSNLGTAVISETARSITSEGVANSSAKPLPAGSIVLSTRAPIGYASIIGQEMSINQGCKAIVVKDPSKVSNEYLYFNLLTQTQKMKELGSGSTFRELSQHNLKSIEIPLPDVVEQKKIASLLNKIKVIIKEQNSIVLKSKALKAALMEKLFTEGTKKEELRDTVNGKMPTSWEIVPFVDIAEFRNGINFSKEQKGEQGYPTVDVYNMYAEGTDLDLSKLYRVNGKFNSDYILKTGDLLFVRSSLKPEGVGWVSMFRSSSEPTLFCGFIIRARVLTDSFIPEFLVYLLRTHEFRSRLINAKGTVGITNISQDVLKDLQIPKPSKEEQKEIVDVLLSADENIKLEQAKSTYYQELFDALIDKLMTGEISVKDVDIN